MLYGTYDTKLSIIIIIIIIKKEGDASHCHCVFFRVSFRCRPRFLPGPGVQTAPFRPTLFLPSFAKVKKLAMRFFWRLVFQQYANSGLFSTFFSLHSI